MHNVTTAPHIKHCIQKHNNTNLDQQHHSEDAGALVLGHNQPHKTSACQALAQPSLNDGNIPLLMHNMTTLFQVVQIRIGWVVRVLGMQMCLWLIMIQGECTSVFRVVLLV